MSVPTTEGKIKNLQERTANIGIRMDGIGTAMHELVTDNKKIDDKLGHVMHRMDNIEKPPKPDKSELYAALAAAQGEIEAAVAKSEADMGNYKYKYADLAACLEVIRKPLSDNGLCLIQIPSIDEGGDNGNLVTVESILGHSSGQSISCTMSMRPDKGGPQAIGGIITYLRRYSLSAMIGVAQFDDDAASATKGPDDYERMSARDIDEILIRADELFGDDADHAIAQMVEKVFNKTHLADVPAAELKVALQRLQNNANLQAKKKEAEKKAAKTPKAETAREPGEDDE